MLISLIFTAISEDMAKRDSREGDEGGDEDLEQEEELGGKIIIIIKQSLLLLLNNRYYYYYYYKKVKGYSTKVRKQERVTSGSKWDSEEGGDEDVEQDEELGGKIINNH